MTIDWFTFSAQFVNFFILLYLLKYFFYGPVTRAMDEREQHIREKFEEAERTKEEAEETEEEYRKQQAELADDREAILEEAREEAEQTREELVDEARDEAEDLKERWLREVRREKQQFLEDLRHRAGVAMRNQMERVLEELADQSLERRMIDVFVQRIEELGDPEREAFQQALREAGNALTVDSTYELAPDDRQSIEEVVLEVFGSEVTVEFGTDEDVICGIELQTPGQRLGWSVREYLERIEERVTALLDEQISETDSGETTGAVASADGKSR